MATKRFVCFWLYAFIVLCSNPGYAQTPTVALTADDIMRITTENLNKNDMLKTELVSFERTKTEYDLDKQGKCKVLNNNGDCASILEKEISKHGKLYSPEERGDNGGLSINLGGILSLGYDYVFVDRLGSYYQALPQKYKYDCDDCYVIWFGPKFILPDITLITPQDSSSIIKGIHETAIRMSGFMYIDKGHLFIRKYVGEITRQFNPEVPYAPDSAARITMGSMALEQELAPELNNIVILTNTEIVYQVRRGWIFGYQTRKLVWKWNNYRLNAEGQIVQ